MRDPAPLTAAQAAVLAVVEAGLRAHGYPPTVREIAEALGGRAPKTAYEHLRALEHKGYIARAYATARGLTVLKSASPPRP